MDLQTIYSVLRDDSRFYDPATYLTIGLLVVAWSFITVWRRPGLVTIWLAIAAIAPLSLLATYHRTHDAKILLLSIPACVMLWAEGRLTGWFAMALTIAGIVFTGDFPLWALGTLAQKRPIPNNLFDKIPAILLMRPVPLVLLAMGVFYLWVYFDRARDPSLPTAQKLASEAV